MQYGFTRGWRGRLVLALWVLGAGLWAAPVGAQGAHPVGHVAELVGEAVVMGPGQSDPRPLAVGTALFEGELIATQPGAKVRLEFVDNSVLTLGENTDLALDWFLHAPDLGTRNVVLRVSAGILRSLVQLVLPHSAFDVETTTAVASVRGTEWIVEAMPEATAIVALDGHVTVRNVDPAVAGQVVLGPGEGTTVRAGAPPHPPARWGEARKNAFIERTTVP